MSTYQDYANSVGNILTHQGDVAARAKEQSGQIWGNTLATLGDVVPKEVQQVLKDRAAKQKTLQIQGIIQQNGGDLDRALPMIMGVDATIGAKLADEHAKVQKSIADVQKIQDDAKKAQLEYSDRLWGQVNDEGTYAHAAMVDKALGGHPLDHYDPEWVKQKKQSLLSLKDQLDANKPMVVGGDLISPKGEVIYQGEKKPIEVGAGGKLVNPETGETIAENPKAPSETGFTLAPGATRYDAQGNQIAAAPKDTSLTPYQEAELGLSKSRLSLSQQREAREAAQQAASNAPPIEIKPGSQDYEVAKDLASGKLTTNDFFRLYGRAASGANKRSGIYLAARQLNPDFDPANFELGFKMAGNPQMVQRVVAINALGPVIDRIEGLVDESGNTGLPGFNKLLNSAKFQLGGKTVTDFRQLQTILGDEVGNALGVGTGSDLKTKLGLDLVNPNLSPANFRSTMEQLRATLESRRQLLQQPMGPYGGRLNPGTTQTSSGPKVGDVKTFPNGKQGRWDGQGWELVTSGAR